MRDAMPGPLSILKANNPTALRPHPGEGWRGSSGAVRLPGGAYQRFTSMAWGLRAALRNLHTYRTRHGLHSPAEIIGRWAPPSDNNPTSAYATNVARWCGVQPREPIPFDYEHNRRLLLAICRQETGGQYVACASDVAKAFSLMAKEERAAGRNPAPYIPSAAQRPVERTVQEGKRVPRRIVAGVFAGIGTAFTQIAGQLSDLCVWAVEKCAPWIEKLAEPPLRPIVLGLFLAGAAFIAWRWFFQTETTHDFENEHDYPDAASGPTNRDYGRGHDADLSGQGARNLDTRPGDFGNGRGFDLLAEFR